jgi:uncharacterized zinc-type alcohol dehydrogenase-like protein
MPQTASGVPGSPSVPSYETRAYAAPSAAAPLGPAVIRRRRPGPRDVRLEVLFCGVCHSDLHQVRDEWKAVMPTVYPCVPGHEIVGRVVEVGAGVKKYRAGDLAAVGCMVDSCRKCPSCRDGSEQFCDAPATFTYNGPDAHLGGVTYGGYSESIVVDEDFVLRVPAGLDPAAAAPLLCAGITTYSPLKHWGAGPGKRVGIVGLGGLGHMGVKFARAFGAHVVVLSGSAAKKADALRLGAHEVVLTSDVDELTKRAGTFDLLLDTVSAKHEIDPLLNLLKLDGTMTLVGAPEQPLPVSSFGLIFKRRRLTGSLIGGICETQEMLDFCGKHGIVSDVEVLPVGKIEEAYARLLKGDVRYRFVLDMAPLRAGR